MLPSVTQRCPSLGTAGGSCSSARSGRHEERRRAGSSLACSFISHLGGWVTPGGLSKLPCVAPLPLWLAEQVWVSTALSELLDEGATAIALLGSSSRAAGKQQQQQQEEAEEEAKGEGQQG